MGKKRGEGEWTGVTKFIHCIHSLPTRSTNFTAIVPSGENDRMERKWGGIDEEESNKIKE